MKDKLNRNIEKNTKAIEIIEKGSNIHIFGVTEREKTEAILDERYVATNSRSAIHSKVDQNTAQSYWKTKHTKKSYNSQRGKKDNTYK